MYAYARLLPVVTAVVFFQFKQKRRTLIKAKQNIWYDIHIISIIDAFRTFCFKHRIFVFVLKSYKNIWLIIILFCMISAHHIPWCLTVFLVVKQKSYFIFILCSWNYEKTSCIPILAKRCLSSTVNKVSLAWKNIFQNNSQFPPKFWTIRLCK